MYNVIFNSGFLGFLIWLLLFAVSTMALAIGVRCAWHLRKSRFGTDAVTKELLLQLKSGDWQSASDYCAAHPALTTKIVNAVLLVAHEKNRAERQEIAAEMLDRRVRAMLRQINSLSMCGNIAPMLGLLGTVTGMVDAFMGLGTAMGPEKASVLAIAISQALYTTAAGLLVAVPAISFTVIFRNLLEKRIEVVTDILNEALILLPEPDVKPEPEPQRKSYHSTETTKFEV
ncbi:MAG: MotA/TolQ/ExbB proton channel family protein [Victivallaceae bacterium]|nr:MotA/TolQ/ExbB proton channel family protein [Victivallaceae bacterium]